MADDKSNEDSRIEDMLGIVSDSDTISADTLEENEQKPEDGAVEEKAEEKAEEKKPEEKKDSYEERYKNLEKLMGRQAQELGQLRSIVAKYEKGGDKGEENPPENADKYLDKFVKDPKAELAKAMQAELDRRDSERTRAEEFGRQNIALLYDKVPEFDSLKNTILELAKEDGIENADMALIEASMRTEFPVILQYARRAQLVHKLRDSANKGKETLQRISKGTRQPPAVTGNSGQTASKSRLSEADLFNMSDDALEKMAQEMGVRRKNKF